MRIENWFLLIIILVVLALFYRALVPVIHNVGLSPSQGYPSTPALIIHPSGPTITPGEGRPATTSRPSEKAGMVEKNLTYCVVNGTELKMDVYYPSRLDRPVPAVIYLHGGGWSSGDKREAERIWEFLKYYPSGFVLVSVNYRLAPAYQFPAQIEDVKCAVRHLRANAERYNVDPERIGVIGVSAGGHLAALLGLTDESAGWDVGENLDQSSRVKAVVVMAAPADFTRQFPAAGRSIAQSVFGVTDPADPKLVLASPVTYISPGDPPFLILQGENDLLVPADQAQTLYERLRAAKVPADLVLIKNAGHSLQSLSGQMSPGPLELALKILSFLDRNL